MVSIYVCYKKGVVLAYILYGQKNVTDLMELKFECKLYSNKFLRLILPFLTF